MSANYKAPRSTDLSILISPLDTVAYLLNARIVEPEQEPLLGKGSEITLVSGQLP
jgi:hypothetical protein